MTLNAKYQMEMIINSKIEEERHGRNSFFAGVCFGAL